MAYSLDAFLRETGERLERDQKESRDDKRDIREILQRKKRDTNKNMEI